VQDADRSFKLAVKGDAMRTRLGFTGGILALAIGCGGQRTAEAEAAARADVTPTYLALGDSVAFGLDPHLVPPVPFSCYSCGTFTGTSPPNDDGVFVGYPELLRQRLGIALDDGSCPGETSASFVAKSTTGQAAICAKFKEQEWLHASYDVTQRRYALDVLARRRGVELVTFSVGANDLLDLVAACGSDPTCVDAGAGRVLASVYANVSGVLSAIRSAGYTGPIVLPGYYAPSPEWSPLVSALNQYLGLAASPSGAVTVDVQAAFGSTPCADGLLLPVDPLDPAAGCDFHPSRAGAQRIADAVASAIGR
jgi:lysophospholipase L1-like esterase